ncbi:Catechol 2,3-dioxygenase or other lactoylglutathione lyase family enzyme [Mycobacterium rhizamassiliense]|jgi:predicted enzyme related to lactoylglutathione lyase|uniref:Catechol 2,3-dioxygenase or other lactoylglutathione lyase family enzyme n=1 Tax=Mycobacterium rhizamassiliense TaxID=1841860 RepID=A0A2U3NSG0_9MYCO|nr:VOC family protein [Mycobacterium rhizamassiliense]SPM34442.1 Catechol 2,3-dioxygenase or other lactoylglutathione lyase family enzyme [Mycobacterium rhizamassiliense]
MALNVEMITVDCSDPATLAAWWAQQFGGTTHDLLADEFTVVTLPEGLQLGFQKVPDPTPGKNRVHLDFGTSDVEDEVSRLKAAGAIEIGRHSFGDDFRWVVLSDPEGNVFCVVPQ